MVALTAVLLALTTTFGLVSQLWHGFLDLMVYRLGAQTWLDGNDIYGHLPALDAGERMVHLPFTYPPLAAIFFSPFAMLPEGLAGALMFGLTIASIAVTVWLVLARIRPEMDLRIRLALVLGTVAAAEFGEPVRMTLGYGQVNALLMAAVAIDLLVRNPRWPRGLLIGIAISIKLTPAGFLLFFLLRRDWRGLLTTVASAIGSVGVVWLLMPDASYKYWFEKLSETSRIGAPYFAGNQSLKGFAFRLGLSDSAASALWIGLSLVAIVLAAVWMHRLLTSAGPASSHPAGVDLSTAVVVNAAAILLVSPISWSHHWVWVVPAIVIALSTVLSGTASARFTTVTGLAIVMFYVGPHWLLPSGDDRELDWAWWQQIVGASYVVFTFAVLAIGAANALRSARADRPEQTVIAPAARTFRPAVDSRLRRWGAR